MGSIAWVLFALVLSSAESQGYGHVLEAGDCRAILRLRNLNPRQHHRLAKMSGNNPRRF
jgi:hypothetical protein